MKRLMAVMALLAGCAEGPSSPSDVARSEFSEQRFCPEQRVASGSFEVATPPSAAVAHDPERLAMWLEASRTRRTIDLVGSGGAGAQRVAVVGCGEKVVYECWNEHGWVPTRRGRRLVDVMAVCSELPRSRAGERGQLAQAAGR